MRLCMNRAFSLVELLVVLAIIGLLLALLLPAVPAGRDTARRMQCASHLRQIGIAIANYENAYGRLPGMVRGFSLHVAVLPYIEQQLLYDDFDFAKYPQDAGNAILASRDVLQFHCPSEVSILPAYTNYGTNKGTGHWEGGDNDGFFVYVKANGGYISSANISDGLSTTVALAEVSSNVGSRTRVCAHSVSAKQIIENCECASFDSKGYVGFPWIEGSLSATSYNHLLTPNTCSCTNDTNIPTGMFTSSSWHPVGVNVLFADGHVDFVASSVTRPVWLAIGSRDAREDVSVLSQF